MSLNLPVCLWLPWKWRLPPSGWADGALALGFSPDKRRAVSLFSLLGDFFLHSQSLKCPRFEMYVAGCEGRRRRRSWDCGVADSLHSYVWQWGPLLQLHQPPRPNGRRRSPKSGRQSKHTRKRGEGGPRDFSWVEAHVSTSFVACKCKCRKSLVLNCSLTSAFTDALRVHHHTQMCNGAFPQVWLFHSPLCKWGLSVPLSWLVAVSALPGWTHVRERLGSQAPHVPLSHLSAFLEN